MSYENIFTVIINLIRTATGNHDEAQNVDSDVDSDIDSNESEEDNINDVQVQKVVQVQKGVQVQNAAKNFHGKGKKKNKGGRKSCKQMECALCMRYHDDPEAQRSMQTFKHINQPRENVSMFFRDCEGS
ncbi:hypothetical protein QL285_084423 [Trifolium repens]|nr:hypothetical protein QL285_084423 [Trifolium repens]